MRDAEAAAESVPGVVTAAAAGARIEDMAKRTCERVEPYRRVACRTRRYSAPHLVWVSSCKLGAHSGHIRYVDTGENTQERRCYCRQCCDDRLGPETAAYVRKVVADAPPPTARQIDAIGRIFEVAAKRIEAQVAAGTYKPTQCPRPNCECGRGPEEPSSP